MSQLRAPISRKVIARAERESGMDFLRIPVAVKSARLEDPPKKLNNVTVEQLVSLLQIIGASPSKEERARALSWIELLRRFVELNRKKLNKTMIERFGGIAEAQSAAAVMLHVLALASQNGTVQKLRDYPDIPVLNAALYLMETKKLFPDASLSGVDMTNIDGSRRHIFQAHKLIYHLLDNIHDLFDIRGEQVWCEIAAPDAPESHNTKADRAVPNFSVVILCPNVFSIFATASMYLLHKKGIHVQALVVRKMISVSRIKEELRFSAARLIARVYGKLIIKHGGFPEDKDHAPEKFLKHIGCPFNNSVKLAKHLDIPIHYVEDYNSEKTISIFKKMNATYAVFAGGGIVKRRALDAFEGGILNCHPGVLPQYKGMDVVHWALIEGAYGQVGATVQVMNTRIDGGPIVRQMQVDPTSYKSLAGIWNDLVGKRINLMVEAVGDLKDGRRQPVPLTRVGRQYFLMHAVLLEIAIDLAAKLGRHR